MVAAATSLVFNIIGNNRASQALSAVGDSVDGLGDKVKKWGLAAAAGVAAVGVAAVSFGVSAVNAASDLNETMSKSSAIFGDQADDISKWGDTAAKNMGLSKAAAVAAAAGFGDMFTQIGFSGDAAADMSKDVVQMSADLGSFNNLGTEDVADRISAAFRGEYDSLQALIPNINAARVEQEALAATGKTAASELTAQEKAAAVLAIVHKDGARAAGDFAKTSDGLANQQKILSASFDDVKAKVGTALLPVLTKLGTFAVDKLLPGLQRLSDIVVGFLGPAFAGLTSGFQENDVTSTGLFGTFEKLGVALRSVATWATTTLIPAMRDLWSWYAEHLGPAVANLVTQIMSGLSSAFDTIKSKIEENKPQLEQLWHWFKTIAEFITDEVYPVLAVFLRTALQLVGAEIGLVIDTIGFLVDTINWLVTATQSAAGWISNAWGNVTSSVQAMSDGAVAIWDGLINWVGAIPGRITGALGDMGSLLYNAGLAVLNGFWNGLKAKWESIKSWVSSIGGWIQDLKGPLDYDKKLLIPQGGAIMDGFQKGLLGGWDDVQRLVSKFAPAMAVQVDGGISGGASAAPGGASLAPSLASGLVGGPITIIVQLDKEQTGELLTMGKVRKEIRTQFGGNVQLALGL